MLVWEYSLEATKLNLTLISSRVFIVVFFYSIFSGFREYLHSIVIPRFLQDLGYTTLESNVINSLLSLAIFFTLTVSFFVVLYQSCKDKFIENIASIIVSLIVGTIVGYWIGGLIGFALSGYPIFPSIYLFGNLLTQFAACSAAYVATKWRISTPKPHTVTERPAGVTLVAVFYVFLALFLSVLTGLLLLSPYTISPEVFLLKPLILAGLIFLLGIASIIYFLIAYGFYAGRRWGWLVIFAYSLISIFSFTNQIIFRFYLDLWLLGEISLLLLSLFIFIYLLQPHVRIYFGIMNPQSETSGN